MDRKRITSGGAYEAVFGYCRAVRVGDNVYVAGTAPLVRWKPPGPKFAPLNRGA